jgi:hypothetical protein
MTRTFTKHQWHGALGASAYKPRPVTLAKISFDPEERAMAKKKARKQAKRRTTSKRKPEMAVATVALADLERRVAGLERRVTKIEGFLGDDLSRVTNGSKPTAAELPTVGPLVDPE